MVARLEKIPARAIERVGDKEYLKYEDRSLRLLRLHHYLPVQPPTESPDDLFVILGIISFFQMKVTGALSK